MVIRPTATDRLQPAVSQAAVTQAPSSSGLRSVDGPDDWAGRAACKVSYMICMCSSMYAHMYMCSVIHWLRLAVLKKPERGKFFTTSLCNSEFLRVSQPRKRFDLGILGYEHDEKHRKRYQNSKNFQDEPLVG